MSTKAESEYENYGWWKIVVALIIFCAMAGIILWTLKLLEHSKCRKSNEKTVIEDSASNISEKIDSSRV